MKSLTSFRSFLARNPATSAVIAVLIVVASFALVEKLHVLPLQGQATPMYGSQTAEKTVRRTDAKRVEKRLMHRAAKSSKASTKSVRELRLRGR